MPSKPEFEEESPLEKFGQKRCDELVLIADQLLRNGSWTGPRQTLESLSLPEAEYVLFRMEFYLSSARRYCRNFKELVADMQSARIVPLYVTPRAPVSR